jgi:hypothetical protein
LLNLSSHFYAPPATTVSFILKQIGRIACALKTKFLTAGFVFLESWVADLEPSD